MACQWRRCVGHDTSMEVDGGQDSYEDAPVENGPTITGDQCEGIVCDEGRRSNMTTTSRGLERRYIAHEPQA